MFLPPVGNIDVFKNSLNVINSCNSNFRGLFWHSHVVSIKFCSYSVLVHFSDICRPRANHSIKTVIVAFLKVLQLINIYTCVCFALKYVQLFVFRVLLNLSTTAFFSGRDTYAFTRFVSWCLRSRSEEGMFADCPIVFIPFGSIDII